jgi:predicted ArsR family transcriptional regulator
LSQFEGKQTGERIETLVKVMEGLGFNARKIKDFSSNEYAIEANNCIYHDLAQKHEEICEFDRSLMSSLLNKDIDQVECMAKGGAVCHFKIINK